MELERARILLVGATGVLGGRLARELAARGARLAVTGRDSERLAAIADEVEAEHRIRVDLIDVEAVAAAVNEAAERLGGLDGLVIASGVAAFGSARDEDEAIIEELFAVNALGPMAPFAQPLATSGTAVRSPC